MGKIPKGRTFIDRRRTSPSGYSNAQRLTFIPELDVFVGRET
jgi:hypothetical protein